jgi:hypothetical protein
VFEIIIGILGIVTSALYVGFLAYSIRATPLWIIVVLTFALMIREFVLEIRDRRGRAAARRERGG